MSLGSVSAVDLHGVAFGNTLKSVTSQKEVQTVGQNPIEKLASVPTSKVLAQMGNVSFTSRYKYGKDDFSAYGEWTRNHPGGTPPDIEIGKYRASLKVQEYIDNEDYLSAIKGKLRLAEINKKQGNDEDAFLLEEGIRKLYKDLPKYQKEEAKVEISKYNSDMAKYIDEDIKKL